MQLEVESQQQIDHGGGTANLDVLLREGALVVGVESKLTEPLHAHDRVTWRAPYHDAKMKAVLSDVWNEVFAACASASLSGVPKRPRVDSRGLLISTPGGAPTGRSLSTPSAA